MSWGATVQRLVTRPDIRVSCEFIDRGPRAIETRVEAAIAAANMIPKAIEAEKGGAEAIVIDCFGDPGLEVLRECVSIPVVGPGATAMRIAWSRTLVGSCAIGARSRRLGRPCVSTPPAKADPGPGST